MPAIKPYLNFPSAPATVGINVARDGWTLSANGDFTPWLDIGTLGDGILQLLLSSGSCTLTLTYEATNDDGVTVVPMKGLDISADPVTAANWASTDAGAASAISKIRQFNAAAVKVRARISAFTSGGPVTVKATYVSESGTG